MVKVFTCRSYWPVVQLTLAANLSAAINCLAWMASICVAPHMKKPLKHLRWWTIHIFHFFFRFANFLRFYSEKKSINKLNRIKPFVAELRRCCKLGSPISAGGLQSVRGSDAWIETASCHKCRHRHSIANITKAFAVRARSFRLRSKSGRWFTITRTSLPTRRCITRYKRIRRWMVASETSHWWRRRRR